MNAHAALVLVVVVHFAPEHLADALGQSSAAWHYVAYGLEAAALWLILGVIYRTLPVLAVSAYGAMEGLQRSACRLALPMDRAPQLHGMSICDAATGLPASVVSLLAAMVVVVLADTGKRP